MCLEQISHLPLCLFSLTSESIYTKTKLNKCEIRLYIFVILFQSTVKKKKMFYQMKAKTFWRNFSDMTSKLRDIKQDVLSEPYNRIKALFYAIKVVRTSRSESVVSPGVLVFLFIFISIQIHFMNIHIYMGKRFVKNAILLYLYLNKFQQYLYSVFKSSVLLHFFVEFNATKNIIY